MNGELILPEPPEAICFKFARLGEESGLDELDLFTLTWFYRAFGLYQPIPQQEQRFFCPCHRGVFDPNGVAVSGPPADAGQSLSSIPLEVDEKSGVIYIEVRDIERRRT